MRLQRLQQLRRRTLPVAEALVAVAETPAAEVFADAAPQCNGLHPRALRIAAAASTADAASLQTISLCSHSITAGAGH